VLLLIESDISEFPIAFGDVDCSGINVFWFSFWNGGNIRRRNKEI